MRHGAQQHFAFDQRLPNQPELEKLKITQPAMEQLGGPRRRRRGEIAHLCQFDAQAAARRVAGDATSVNPAADDEQINGFRRIVRVFHAPSPMS